MCVCVFVMAATPEKEMAGYLVGAVRSVGVMPGPEMAEAFMKMGMSTKDDTGFEKVFLGPALTCSELGKDCPNMSFVMKLKSKDKAVEFYESEAYKAWASEFRVGENVMRDVRIIEAPADLFTPGKAYWIALIHHVLDTERFGAYFQAFVAANEKGFEVTLDDGSTEKANLEIKFVGPSDFREEAVKYVPAAGKGAPFLPGTSTDTGIVLVAELASHAIGATFKQCVDYKNTMLAAFNETFTDDVSYDAKVKVFMEEIFRRDVRIIAV